MVRFYMNQTRSRILDLHKDGHGVKELQERCIIKAFKLSNQERYEHVGPKVTSSQDGKVYKMAKRDYAWLMISSLQNSNRYHSIPTSLWKTCHLPFEIEHRAYWALRSCNPDLKITGEKQFLQLHELDQLILQAYENSKLYKAQTKAYHDKKLRVRKEFKAEDKVLLYNSKYKFKAPKLRSKWYGPFIVKRGYPSGYVELYDKHGGSFIVNGYHVKLYHDKEQLNELTIEEIHLMSEDGRMKSIPFMAPFPANYHETMPWASEKPYIYSVMENTCNEAICLI
ncbi:hypothetical protein Tco_0058829 [Tanacetum coccineum]